MSDATLIKLKVLVERAVRPVRASEKHKQKMRLELFAHLTAIFEQEMLNTKSEQAAREASAMRFGNPAELTKQLQAAVPPRDRIRSIIDQIWFRHGESWLRRAVRQAIIIELLILFALFRPWLMAGAPMKVFSEATMWRFSQFLLGFLFVSLCFTLLAEWMRRALHGRPRRSHRQVAMITSAMGLISFVFVLATKYLEGYRPLEHLLPLLPPVLFLTIWLTCCLAAFVNPVATRIRDYEEWARLPI